MKYYRQYKMSEIEEFYYDFITLIYLKKYNCLNIKNLILKIYYGLNINYISRR